MLVTRRERECKASGGSVLNPETASRDGAQQLCSTVPGLSSEEEKLIEAGVPQEGLYI